MIYFILKRNIPLATCLLLAIFTFFICVGEIYANDDHSYRHRKQGRKHLSLLSYDKDDKGNEFTGQAAAWIFVAGNITIAVSLILKTFVRFFPLENGTRNRIKIFNKFQKKYLRNFHYFLNPLAVILALVHFSLSSCRSSALPEWGLVATLILVLIGVVIKIKLTPKSIRRVVYNIHTSPLPFGIIVIVLLIGHGIVD